jgi:hypothetical protein
MPLSKIFVTFTPVQLPTGLKLETIKTLVTTNLIQAHITKVDSADKAEGTLCIICAPFSYSTVGMQINEIAQQCTQLDKPAIFVSAIKGLGRAGRSAFRVFRVHSDTCLEDWKYDFQKSLHYGLYEYGYLHHGIVRSAGSSPDEVLITVDAKDVLVSTTGFVFQDPSSIHNSEHFDVRAPVTISAQPRNLIKIGDEVILGATSEDTYTLLAVLG